MKGFIKKLCLFIFIIVIAYPIIIFLIGYYPVSDDLKRNINYRLGAYGHSYTRFKEVKNIKDSIDILFLGSSHTYRGFDPRNFNNKNIYNLGSSSQTPEQTKILLERYIDIIKPKLVIYEVYPDNFTSDGVESAIDIISNDNNDYRTLYMAIVSKNIKAFNTLVYASVLNLLKLNKNFEEPETKYDDKYIKGGYVERAISYYNYVDYPIEKWNIRAHQLNAFNKSLELLKRKNITTILVYAPITTKRYKAYSNKDEIDSIFKSYNLEYYNFNEIMQLDDSLHFYDFHHLNQNGVNLFNNKLIEVLDLK